MTNRELCVETPMILDDVNKDRDLNLQVTVQEVAK